ncbi:unnamed protein product [Gongylonema pulchrum]|uniref:Uncharacterized protein n=1 Tax=Gongylonema pulchrum TaxID=637853 RepID=A0A183E7S0_9BILA|nr:unnamed protein product [Gongylonema pulchrum]
MKNYGQQLALLIIQDIFGNHDSNGGGIDGDGNSNNGNDDENDDGNKNRLIIANKTAIPLLFTCRHMLLWYCTAQLLFLETQTSCS